MYAWVTTNRHAAPYLSTVYGCGIHEGIWSEYEEGWHEYYVVLDEHKESLINVDTYSNITKDAHVHIVTVDSNKDNWLPVDSYYGCVDFLNKYNLETLYKDISQDDLDKCIKIDKSYVYQPIQEVKTNDDVINLENAAFNFHDAQVIKSDKNGSDMHVLIDNSSWGSQIELWLKGDAEYCLGDIEEPKYFWWDGSSTFFDKGCVWLTDEENITSVDDLPEDAIYLKGRQMFYQVHPKCY